MVYRRGGKTRRHRKSRSHKTIRHVPWAGWAKQAPQGHQRTIMKRDCGRKCFLGPKKSFPVCKKYTCDISKKGLWAAYIRARQWGKPRRTYRGKSRPRHPRGVYTKVARTARRMLHNRGVKVGRTHRR